MSHFRFVFNRINYFLIHFSKSFYYRLQMTDDRLKFKLFTRSVFILPLCLVLFVLIPTLTAQNNILPFREIKAGMKGYGLSVFKGITIEKFDVEIIGVLKGARPRSGLILAKLSDNEHIEKAGVIAGMSGSPIYVNNKLIGALAFSWGFSKEAITGITPIEDMLDVLKLNTTNRVFHFEPSGDKSYASLNNYDIIKTPIIIDHDSDSLMGAFKKDLEEMNFLPLAGLGNSEDYEIPEKFEPGSSVGVNLITGDLNIAGIGTVTYTNNGEILIFGHPMFASGGSDMPLSYAYIHTVVPTLSHSFKMGTATKIVGRINQDQLAGLSGILNQKSDMLPVDVNIQFFHQKNNYHYNIIRSYFFLPNFLSMALYSSLQMQGGMLEKNTIDFSFELNFNNTQKIVIHNTLASLSTAETLKTTLLYLLNPLTFLMNNKFEQVVINNIVVDMKINNTIKIAEIKKIIVNNKSYAPGEKVDLKIKLQAYQGKVFYKELSIPLPLNLNEGKFTIIVSSDMERQYVEFLLSPQKFNPQTLDQLITLYNTLPKSTDLSVWAMVKDRGLVLDGEALNQLPGSYYSILQNSLDSIADRSVVLIKNNIPLNYIVMGSSYININVQKEIGK